MYIQLPSGLVIGGRSQDLLITDWESSGISFETSDVIIPNRPGLYAGRSRLTEITHTFTLNTGPNVRTLAHAQEVVDQLTSEWVAGASLPHGETFPIVVETRADRRRRIYGRPTKITSVDPDVRAKQGSVEILMEYVQTDPTAYEEEDQRFSISVLPKQAGGIKAPLVAPIKSVTWSGVGHRFVENLGDAPAAMSVTFHGPSKNPSLAVIGQVVALNRTLQYDESITIDGRSGSVTNQSGANMSRYLTSRSRLDALKLNPGSWEVSFRAEDDTNTARADIVFASAYRNI